MKIDSRLQTISFIKLMGNESYSSKKIRGYYYREGSNPSIRTIYLREW